MLKGEDDLRQFIVIRVEDAMMRKINRIAGRSERQRSAWIRELIQKEIA